MQPDVKERRLEVFDQYVLAGNRYTDVCNELAEKYNVSTKTIERDISDRSEWIPKLPNELPDRDASRRLLELRRNRKQLHQLADSAREDGDIGLELKIRRQIDRALEMELSLSRELDYIDSNPGRESEPDFEAFLEQEGGPRL